LPLCLRSRAAFVRKHPTFVTKTTSTIAAQLVRTPIRHHHADGRRVFGKMYRSNAGFVFTVTRAIVRTCQTPVLILPNDIPAHPYAVAMESAFLAPKAQVSLYLWKDPKDRIPLAARHIRSFLQAHRSMSGAD
jgi:hypothetical protein